MIIKCIGSHSPRVIKGENETERETVPEAYSPSANPGTFGHKLTADVRGSAPKRLKPSVLYGAAQDARIGPGYELQRACLSGTGFDGWMDGWTDEVLTTILYKRLRSPDRYGDRSDYCKYSMRNEG